MKELLKKEKKEAGIQDYLLPQKAFSFGTFDDYKIKVYYISDIHLLHHLGKAGKDYYELKLYNLWDETVWENIKTKIDCIVKNMFSQELQEDILSWKKKVLLIFGGDISSDTKITQYFYHKVKMQYMYIEYVAWKRRNHYIAPMGEEEAEQIYTSTLKTLESRLEAEFGKLKKYYIKFRNWKSLSKEQIIEKLEKRNPPSFFEYRKRKIYKMMAKIHETSDQRFKERFIEGKISGTKFVKRENYPIYVVLGNHELNDFSTLQAAVGEYEEFFLSEGIHFLHNGGYILDISDIFGTKCFILGGIGFAKYNKKYNVDTLCTTTPPMSREEEIRESEKCFDLYKQALAARKKCYGVLIFVTHYPVRDWMPKKSPMGCCTFFTGHTHRDSFKYNDIVQIYADNQIGYGSKKIKFKSCCLGHIYNPFITYGDGYYSISLQQYVLFMKFCGESIKGTGNIERQIINFNSKFYMVKRKGYYGFFVINERTGTKICEGGRIRNVSEHTDIEYFYNNFINFVEIYLRILGPFRKLEERLAGEVKKLGFSGEIHGLIIDLGLNGEVFPENHIMLNPYDGKITIYYSPIYGVVMKVYKSFLNFIEEWVSSHVKEEKYLQIKETYQEMGRETALITLENNKIEEEMSEFVILDIKDSLYSESAKVKKLQRLFTSNVLRDWDESLMETNENIFLNK